MQILKGGFPPLSFIFFDLIFAISKVCGERAVIIRTRITVSSIIHRLIDRGIVDRNVRRKEIVRRGVRQKRFIDRNVRQNGIVGRCVCQKIRYIRDQLVIIETVTLHVDMIFTSLNTSQSLKFRVLISTI